MLRSQCKFRRSSLSRSTGCRQSCLIPEDLTPFLPPPPGVSITITHVSLQPTEINQLQGQWHNANLHEDKGSLEQGQYLLSQKNGFFHRFTALLTLVQTYFIAFFQMTGRRDNYLFYELFVKNKRHFVYSITKCCFAFIEGFMLQISIT